MAKKNIDNPVNETKDVKKVGRGGIIAMEIFVILMAFLTIAVPIVLPIFRFVYNEQILYLSIFQIAMGGSVFNMIPNLPSVELFNQFHYSLVELFDQQLSFVIGPIAYNVITFAVIIGIICAIASIILAIVGIATRKAKGSFFVATCGMAVSFFITYLTPVILFSIGKLANITPLNNVMIDIWLPNIAMGTIVLLDLIVVILYHTVAHKQLASTLAKQEAELKAKELEEAALKEVEPVNEVVEEPIQEEAEPGEVTSIDGSEYYNAPKSEEVVDENGFRNEPESDNVVVSPKTVIENQPKKVVKKIVKVKPIVVKGEPLPEEVKTEEKPPVKKVVKVVKKVPSKTVEEKPVEQGKKVVVKKVVKVVKKPSEPVKPVAPVVVKESKAAPIFRNETKDLKRLPKKLTEIGESRFENNAKIELGDIPNGITELGKASFANCANLKEVEIPSSVIKISNKTFYKCANLKTIRYEGTREEFRSIERGAGWLAGGGTKLVNCSDGVISVNQFK